MPGRKEVLPRLCLPFLSLKFTSHTTVGFARITAIPKLHTISATVPPLYLSQNTISFLDVNDRVQTAFEWRYQGRAIRKPKDKTHGTVIFTIRFLAHGCTEPDIEG